MTDCCSALKLQKTAKDSLNGEIGDSFAVHAGDGKIIIGGSLD